MTCTIPVILSCTFVFIAVNFTLISVTTFLPRSSMARYSKKEKVSEQTKEEAVTIAKGIQKPGQSKEQTKLVAQGIQKGIELYKKQHKEKSRELDKKLRKAKEVKPEINENDDSNLPSSTSTNRLPWLLLVVSWLGFIGFIAYSKFG